MTEVIKEEDTKVDQELRNQNMSSKNCFFCKIRALTLSGLEKKLKGFQSFSQIKEMEQ